MNHMKYDVMTVGNHEFNWGVETMKKILSQASFPVLGANILDPDGNYVTGKGWTIVERGGIRLGVVGVCTPDIPIWDGGKEGIDEITYEAGYTAVKKAIEEIGDQADIILVSAHMGQYAEYDVEAEGDSGEKIVEENPEIARIDVTLDADKTITDISTQIIDMADYEPSEELRQNPVVKKLHDTAVIDLILNVQLLNSGADVTACALFKNTSDLPEGPIQYGNIFDIYEFDNTLYTMDVTVENRPPSPSSPPQSAPFGQFLAHSIHKIHSVPFSLFLELSVTSTFIGHTFLHFPQEMHLSLSHFTRITE